MRDLILLFAFYLLIIVIGVGLVPMAIRMTWNAQPEELRYDHINTIKARWRKPAARHRL